MGVKLLLQKKAFCFWSMGKEMITLFKFGMGFKNVFKRRCPSFIALIVAVLVSCSVEGTRIVSHLRNSIIYNDWMVEGHRKIKGRVEIFTTSSERPVILIWKDSGARTDADLPNRSFLSRFDDVSPSVEYDLEILTSYVETANLVFNEVLSISHQGEKVFDATACPVHHLSMVRQIEEGCSECDTSKKYLQEREKKFPNDGKSYFPCSSAIRRMTWKCEVCYKLSLQ
jgi:hypothetical protein